MDSINKLILGDNLEILKSLDSGSVDLIYLDPPFFSNRNYEVIWGDEGEVRSFADRWSGGMDHYIGWLKERVAEMHRILKPTGSIFLHCDWHADAYIRVDILDKVFGINNFRNKITWKRADTHNDAKKQFPNVCDDIFFYSKSDKYTFNVQYTEHNPKTLKEWYQYLEFPDGTIRKMTEKENEEQKFPSNARRFNADNMASPNPRPNLMYEYKGYSYPVKGWRYSLETMQKLDSENKLLYPKEKAGRIMLKRFLDEQKGAVVGDMWLDIDQIRAKKAELIGYPTQKPFELMQRIIECASNEGDLVLDPFVGGGTTVAAADLLGRKWIGIDQSVTAVKVSEMRLDMQQSSGMATAKSKVMNMFAANFMLVLHKYDYDTLRYKDAFAFESFIVTQYGGTTNTKQRGDMGLDGRARDGAPIQVKRSDDIGRNVVDNFFSAVQRYDKKLYDKNVAAGSPVGYIIAFSFGKGAVQEVARLKNHENVIIQLVTVESIIPIAKKPALTVEIKEAGRDKKNVRELTLTAKGTSVAGIEFYSWDFDYHADKGFKPEVIIDKTGVQTYKFKPGTHHIAVKVVDNDGLDNIEVVKLKVNGTVERG
jgi:DNA modification methylase